jgi:RNA polymerase sigma factor (sigma-70 family)
LSLFYHYTIDPTGRLVLQMTADARTDAELVIAARAGDKEAFGQLVERHLLLARRVAVGMTGNREIAWELAQEAVLQAYLALDTLRTPERFQHWLYGIVRNLCQSYLRSQKTATFALDTIADVLDKQPFLSGTNGDPQRVIEERELVRRVQAAIELLSPKNQAATRLFYFEDLSISEIAIQLGISVTAIKGRLYQSRKQLQAHLASVYAEHEQPRASLTDERKPNMVKISAVHVIDVEPTNHKILYLLEPTGHRGLPIWVGQFEGEQIAQYLREATAPRPMTYHFMAGLLNRLGAKLHEVRIEVLKEFTYYATASVRDSSNTYELDARPSDAVALALHTGASIFVADEVMQQAGQDLPQPFDEQAWLQETKRRLLEWYEIAKEWDRKLKGEPGLFTPDALQILQQTQAIAQKLNHNYIGTEHLLLSLAENGGSEAANVLRKCGIDPGQVARAVERLVGRGKSPPSTDPVLTPRVAHVLALATEAQMLMGHPQVGVKHLLLGIIREGQGMAMTILRELGADVKQMQVKLLEQLSIDQPPG